MLLYHAFFSSLNSRQRLKTRVKITVRKFDTLLVLKTNSLTVKITGHSNVYWSTGYAQCVLNKYSYVKTSDLTSQYLSSFSINRRFTSTLLNNSNNPEPQNISNNKIISPWDEAVTSKLVSLMMRSTYKPYIRCTDILLFPL